MIVHPLSSRTLMSKTYEDLVPEIEELLSKYRSKWHLTSLSWLDYDDVSQIIRAHIHKKWDMWDQKRAFRPWASILIGNQIKNLIRNHYGNFAKPCLRCDHFMGNEGCSFTESKVQDVSCDIFAKWQKKKKNAFNIKMATSLDALPCIKDNVYDDDLDYERSVSKVHALVMNNLNERHREVYRLLYVEGWEEEAVAVKFGFKKDPSKRKTIRYKQINNLKKKFRVLASKLIKEEDV